jgi:hypothetical protein
MDVEEFAAKRDERLASFDKELGPLVERYLPSRDWANLVEAASVLWAETFEETSPGGTYDAILKRFQNELLEALKRTSTTSDAGQAARVTMWLGTYAINDATYYGARSNGFAQKRWVTAGDADVRDTHRAAAGQTVGIADSFTVGGQKMRYPGEPVGDPSLFINCRCLVQHVGTGRTFSMTAFATDAEPIEVADEPDDETFEERTGVVIVALPAADDPVVAASSEDIAHMTLVWLGDAAQLPNTGITVDDLKANLTSWASTIDGPLTEGVSGSATLGADGASVVLVDAHSIAQIRNGMVDELPEDVGVPPKGMGAIAQVHSQTEQFPTWLPHVTLGYPETPALAEYAGTEITFDRLALWVGDDRTEYPMGQNLTAAAIVTEPPVEAEPVSDDGQEEFDIMLGPGATDDLEEMGTDPIPFHGVAVPTGVLSGDNRMFAAGESLTWRNLPLPLTYQDVSADGHGNTVTVGRIDWFKWDGNLLQYGGVFASGGLEPLADKVVGGIAEGWIKGVSVDIDMIAMQAPDMEAINDLDEQAAVDLMMNPPAAVVETARVASVAVVQIPAFQEAYIALGPCDCPDEVAPDRDEVAPEEPAMTDDEFAVIADELFSYLAEDPELRALLPDREEGVANLVAGAQFAPGTKDGPGWITEPKATSRIRRYWVSGKGAAKIRWGAPGDFNRCRSQLAKYIANPEWLAGTCANMHKEALGVWPGRENGSRALVASGAAPAPAFNLVAAAAPPHPAGTPDGAWFENPQLTGPTPFTVEPDGRVYGHVATWGVCHIGVQGVCQTAPNSPSGYAYFRTGLVETTYGDVRVGQITMGTGHANLFAKAGPALEHYDNTGTAVADVAAGEDAYGIWVAGSLREGVTDKQRRDLRAAALSGDWRAMPRGGQELVAALAVNTPGFPIPRMGLAASGMVQESLVATGIVEHEEFATKKPIDYSMEFVSAVADVVEHRAAMRARKTAALAAVRPVRIQNAKKKGQS